MELRLAIAHPERLEALIVQNACPLADSLAYGRGRSVDENLDVVCGAYAVNAGPDESGGVDGGQRPRPESCPGAA